MTSNRHHTTNKHKPRQHLQLGTQEPEGNLESFYLADL
jgi:hypothetical protein